METFHCVTLVEEKDEDELFISIKQVYMHRIKVPCFGIGYISSDILFFVCFTFPLI